MSDQTYRPHRSLRRRTLVAVGAAATVLVLGTTLTACGEDEGGDDKSSSQQESGGSEQSTDAGSDQAADTEEAPANSGPLADGEPATFQGNLEVTVSGLKEFTPSEYSAGHTEGNVAYQVTVVMTNTGQEAFDGTFAAATATAGPDGVPAELILDDGVGSGITGTIATGKKMTVDLAFDVPQGAQTLDVEVKPDVTGGESAIWSIPLA